MHPTVLALLMSAHILSEVACSRAYLRTGPSWSLMNPEQEALQFSCPIHIYLSGAGQMEKWAFQKLPAHLKLALENPARSTETCYTPKDYPDNAVQV